MVKPCYNTGMFEHSGGGRRLCLLTSAPKKNKDSTPKRCYNCPGFSPFCPSPMPSPACSRMKLPNTAEHSQPIRLQHHCRHRYTVSLAVLLPSPGVGLLTVPAQFVSCFEYIHTHIHMIWCSEPESNRHAVKREILSLLCLPISPSERNLVGPL